MLLVHHSESVCNNHLCIVAKGRMKRAKIANLLGRLDPQDPPRYGIISNLALYKRS